MNSLDNTTNPVKKAVIINSDKNIYGTFAEIGAGQEVARNFFQAGHASNTIAKTMSAYDMTFSDEIYGKSKDKGYVSQSRLLKMFEKEFSLLTTRLVNKKQKTKFFVFANTITTNRDTSKAHGWIGIRYQSKPMAKPNDVYFHIRLNSPSRTKQQSSISALGVNLIFSVFYKPKDILSSLMDEVSDIEIDTIYVSGPDHKNVDSAEINLKLLTHGLTSALTFNKKGEVVPSGELLFEKDLLIYRGQFNPITNTDMELLKTAKKDSKANSLILPEIQLKANTPAALKEILQIRETLTDLNFPFVVSQFPLLFQLKSFLRNSTSKTIAFVTSALLLEELFQESYYKTLKVGILKAFGQLFDDNTKLLIYPYKTKDMCTTAKTFFPNEKLLHLYQYFLKNKSIFDISNCDHIDTSIRSDYVRKLMKKKDPKWKTLIPESTKNLIQKKKLF